MKIFSRFLSDKIGQTMKIFSRFLSDKIGQTMKNRQTNALKIIDKNPCNLCSNQSKKIKK
jgi:hypothetical protein